MKNRGATGADAWVQVLLRAGRLGTWGWHIPSGRVELGGHSAAVLGYDDTAGPVDHIDAWRGLVHPEDRAQVAAAMEAHLGGRSPDFECEYRIRHRDGSWRWILDRGQVVEHDEQGRPLRAVGTFLDTTARTEAAQAREDRLRGEAAQARQALAEAARFTQDRLDNVLALVALLLPDGTFLEGNRLPFETAGLRPEDVRGLKFWETYWWSESPATQAQLQEAVRRAAGGETVRYDVRLRLAPEQHIWIDFQLAPLRDAGGHITHLIPSAVDITDRKLAEQTLRQSQALLHAVTETAPDAIYAKDRQGRMILANPATLRVIGRPAAEVLGRVEAEWLTDHPEQAAMIMANDQRIMGAGAAEVIEERLHTPEGVRTYLSSKAPLRSPTGEVIGLVGISRDITDRKRVEQRMQDLHAELEAQVAQRTAALLAANTQLQGFTYSVAHDLRQQIRGISANASLLEMALGEALDEGSRPILERLIASAEKLGMLVHDLLAYARLAPHQPERASIDLTALASEAAAVVIERRTSRPDTRVSIAPGLAAHGDLAMIRLVLENLLDNACKYAARVPHPRVEVGQEGGAFFVRDNGIGFDMRYAERIFEPFERLHRDSEYVGTGIGLANVRRIIEKHGGRAWARSTPGEGATFFFTLGPVSSG